MEKAERIYIATFPFDRVYYSRRKKALQKKKRKEPRQLNFFQKVEDLLKIKEIIGIASGAPEEKDIIRDALTIFRIRTFGIIGALLIGTICGFYLYFDSCFSLRLIIFTALSGGIVCSYFAARLTLL